MLCYVILCYAMLCYAMICYAMLCYAMLCYAMLCYVIVNSNMSYFCNESVTKQYMHTRKLKVAH